MKKAGSRISTPGERNQFARRIVAGNKKFAKSRGFKA